MDSFRQPFGVTHSSCNTEHNEPCMVTRGKNILAVSGFENGRLEFWAAGTKAAHQGGQMLLKVDVVFLYPDVIPAWRCGGDKGKRRWEGDQNVAEKITRFAEDVGKPEPLNMAGGKRPKWCSYHAKQFGSSSEVKHGITRRSSTGHIPRLGLYPEELKTGVQTDTRTWVFIAALFPVAKGWE